MRMHVVEVRFQNVGTLGSRGVGIRIIKIGFQEHGTLGTFVVDVVPVERSMRETLTKL